VTGLAEVGVVAADLGAGILTGISERVSATRVAVTEVAATGLATEVSETDLATATGVAATCLATGVAATALATKGATTGVANGTVVPVTGSAEVGVAAALSADLGAGILTGVPESVSATGVAATGVVVTEVAAS
jgi:hypothetical protein